MTKLIIHNDEPKTKKEELKFWIDHLSPNIRGIRRLLFIARFHWWFFTEGGTKEVLQDIHSNIQYKWHFGRAI